MRDFHGEVTGRVDVHDCERGIRQGPPAHFEASICSVGNFDRRVAQGLENQLRRDGGGELEDAGAVAVRAITQDGGRRVEPRGLDPGGGAHDLDAVGAIS